MLYDLKGRQIEGPPFLTSGDLPDLLQSMNRGKWTEELSGVFQRIDPGSLRLAIGGSTAFCFHFNRNDLHRIQGWGGRAISAAINAEWGKQRSWKEERIERLSSETTPLRIDESPPSSSPTSPL